MKKKIIFDPNKLSLNLSVGKEKKWNLNLRNKLSSRSISRPIDRYRLEVSLICDLRCRYCVVHMNRISRTQKLMSKKAAEKTLKRFNKEVGKRGSLMIIGGEPLLNWDVVKYIIENCQGETMLFTNAYKLDEEKVNVLSRHHTMVLTSLDGYTTKHNEDRFYPDVETRFRLICKNIKRVSRKCRVGISCVVHQKNVDDLVPIADFFVKKLGVKSLSFAYPHFTIEKTDTNNFSMEKYTAAICQLLKFAKKERIYIDQIGKILRGILYRETNVSACKICLSQRTFYPDGTETLCTKLDTLPNYSIRKFLDILPVNNPKCQNCVAVNLCGGGCPWDAAVFPNQIGVDKRICRHYQALVTFIINDIESELQASKNQSEAQLIIKEKYLPLTSPSWMT